MRKAHLVVVHCRLIASILYGLIGSCSLHKSRWLKQEEASPVVLEAITIPMHVET